MLYYTLTVKDTDYKLRLSAKACIDVEKKLGENPVNTIINIANNLSKQSIPSLDPILTILHASMTQYNHSVSMNDMYTIYDNYIDEGHNMYELISVIIEVFKVSGLMPEDTEGKN